MKHSHASEYVFLSGYLRAWESRAVTGKRMAQLLDANSAEKAAQLLAEWGYPALKNLTQTEITSALRTYRKQHYEEILHFLPNARILDLFRIRGDYHNMKVILKASALGQSGQQLAAAVSRIPYAELENALLTSHTGELPGALRTAYETAHPFAKERNPQSLDLAIDHAYYAELRALAAELHNPFLTGYVRLLIDSANLRALFRIIRIAGQDTLLPDALIDGGTASPSDLTNAIHGGSEPCFGNTLLSKAWLLGMQAAQGGSIMAMELACDNAITAYLQAAKQLPFGAEVVIAHFAAFETELQSVRILLTGFLAGMDKDFIRERLRESYA